MINKSSALEATTKRTKEASSVQQTPTVADARSNRMQDVAAEDIRSTTVQSEDIIVGEKNPQVKVLPVLFYTGTETAAILKVTEKTVRRLVARGLLKKCQAIRHIRITRRSLDEFLAKN